MIDYEEKYNKLLEHVKNLYERLAGSEKEYLQQVTREEIPELAESEDERIMKCIVLCLEECVHNDIIRDYEKDECLAWLRKQGEKTNPYSGISFEYNGHIWGVCARDNGVDILLDKQLFKHLEKQGGQKHAKTVKDVWKDMRLEAYAQATGNRHEPNYSDDSTKLFSLNDIDEIFEKISEKQGEQNYKIIKGKNYFCVKTHNYAGVEWIKGAKYYASDNYTLVNQGCECYCPEYSKEEHNNLFEEVKCDDCIEKQGEQKHTDKVEPKFKAGDFIISKHDSDIVYKITGIDANEKHKPEYVCEHVGRPEKYVGRVYNMNQDKVNSNFEIWTIQDAKGGDVLSFDNECSNYHSIGLFKRIASKNEPNGNTYRCYVRYGGFKEELEIPINGGELHHCGTSAHPAVKEQRALLFQKMKEAGYEWDSEKKELKKIEQKPEINDDVLSRFAFYQYDNDTIYLSSLFVRESDRRHGYGSKVLKAAEEVAKTFEISKIRLKVERNTWMEEWYKKNGYEYLSSEGKYDWLENRVIDTKPNKIGQKSAWNEEDNIMVHDIDYALRCQITYPISRLQSMSTWINNLKNRVQPKQEWSEEDKKIINALRTVCLLCSHNEMDGRPWHKWADWLKCLLQRFGLQPKQEWSEEDASLCVRIQGILSVCKSHSLLSPDLHKEMCDWLKAIKNRVQPQLKQEWSEEDENEYNHILKILNLVVEEQETKGYNNLIGSIHWLKSLKDRVQPKQEWSKEDERMCQETIDWFEKKCFPYALESENPARESIKWLKALKDRCLPLSKQKLSEEDDKFRKYIISVIEAIPTTDSLFDSVLTKDKFLSWLKAPKLYDVVENQKSMTIPKFKVNDIITSSNNKALRYRIKEVGVKNELGEYDYVLEDVTDNPEYKGRIREISIEKVDNWGVLIERPVFYEYDE